MIRTAALALFLFGVAALAADDPLKPFAGKWAIVDAKLGGRDHNDDFQGMTLTVTGEKYEIAFGPNSDRGTLKVDATKKPPHIDISTRADGPFKGRTLPGIYEFKGDSLVLCLNSEKPDRPTKFEAPAKTPLMVLTFRRDAK